MSITISAYVETNDCPTILEIINFNILNSTALYDYLPRTLAQQQAIFQDKIKKGFPIIVAVENEKGNWLWVLQ